MSSSTLEPGSTRDRSSSGNDEDMARFLEKVRSAEPVHPFQKSFPSAVAPNSDSLCEANPRSKRDLHSFKVLRWASSAGNKSPGNQKRLAKSNEVKSLPSTVNVGLFKVALILAWLGLGAIYTLPGVSLILLSCHSCLRLDLTMLSFVCRAFGSLLGVIFMNVIARNAHLYGTLLVSTICVAIATVALPFVSSLPGILVLMWMLGVVYGVAKQGFQMLGKHLGMREVSKKLVELLFFCIGAVLSSVYTFIYVGSFKVTTETSARVSSQNVSNCHLVGRFYCSMTDLSNDNTLYFYAALPLFLVTALIAIGMFLQCRFKQSGRQSPHEISGEIRVPSINRSFIGIKVQMFVVYFLQDGLAYVLGYLVVIFVYLGKLPSTSMRYAVLASAVYWLSYCLGSVIVMASNHLIKRNEKLYVMLGIKSIGSLVCCAIMAVSETFPQFCISLAIYTVCMASAGEFGVHSIRSRCFVDYRTLTLLTNVSTAFAEMLIPYSVYMLMDFQVAQFMTYSVAGLTLAMWIMCKVLIFSTITSSSEGWTVNSYIRPVTQRSSDSETQRLVDNNDVHVKYTIDGWDVLE